MSSTRRGWKRLTGIERPVSRSWTDVLLASSRSASFARERSARRVADHDTSVVLRWASSRRTAASPDVAIA